MKEEEEEEERVWCDFRFGEGAGAFVGIWEFWGVGQRWRGGLEGF
jgi:hypothetical protein